MKFSYGRVLRRLSLFVFLMLSAIRSEATHVFGIDLYYTYVSGNTYSVHLVIYGDCSAAIFSTLSTSAPVINVYNGNTSYTSITLAIQAPASGVEVTPVCPIDIDSTTCTNTSYAIPGVKKFVYTGNVTLSGPSAVWRFLFQGNLGGGYSAGRSSSITNILTPGSTTMQLVDTLNNTTFNNSSAVYTSIPTPFFCLSQPANFNPGAVDPNGDSLVFNLVPGIDATTGTSVSYIAPYTATAPIGVSPGTFSFNTATGQLAFTPNILQKALTVYNVEEFHNGVLRGTTQREMTVVVITPCTNTPPNGNISGASAGTITGATTLSICQAVGPFSFHINPTDPDGNHITMSVAGLPTGATFGIVNNGTVSPLGTFSWSTTGVSPGNYIFYVTYKDDGCPLAGEQTIAYTITVLPMPTELFALVSPATCLAKAVFHVTPGGSASPWTMKVIQAGVTIQTITGVTGMVTDSLVPGTYTIRMTNPSGCFVDTTITLISPPLPVPTVVTSPPLCPGGATGSATISGSGGLAPYLYAIGGGAYSGSGVFAGLSPGSYVLHIKDANGCVKDTTVTVPNAPLILLHLGIRKPLCNAQANGRVVIDAYNSVAPYTYALGSGLYTSNDTFNALAAGTYTFHIKNANGCIADTILVLVDSTTIHATLAVTPILCHSGTGTVTMTGSSGFGPPYLYAYNGNPFGATNVFTFVAGTYTMHIKDSNNCFFDTSVTLTQPTAIAFTTADTNVHCNGAATGIIVITATGGTPGYLYNVDGGAWSVLNVLSGLTAGVHLAGVKDINGCIDTIPVTITQPTPVRIDSVIRHQPLCNAGSNGSLTIYASGGVSTYTYALGAGAYSSSSLFPALAAGTYILHVKDANGCIKDTTVNLLQPGIILPAATVKKSVCSTLANGKVTLSASGGTPGYTFAMGTGVYGTTSVFTPLAAGTYTFHIKDANSCIHDTIIVVSDSLLVSGAFTITAALCYNQSSGTIDVLGNGGAGPYTYSLGTFAFGTSHLFSGLPVGIYPIHVKDANGCQFDTLIPVSQPTDIVPNIVITQPSCYGYSDGLVTVSATGGTPGYTYSYDNSLFTATTIYPGQIAGTDSVKVKDANGCIHDTVFVLNQPDAIRFSVITSTNISCFGGSDGTVTINAAGATPPYTYGLNALPMQVSNVFSGLTSGLEFVRVQDSHGCEADTNVLLTQPTKLLISGLDTLNPTCPGYKDGSIKVFGTGGTSPYTYSDDNTNFGSGNNFATLGAGSYTLVLKDANGCTADTTITLKGIPAIVVDSALIKEPLCYNAKNGSLSLYASGGAPPIAYQFNGSAVKTATAIYKNIHAGQYSIVISDSRNCFIDTTLNVRQPDSLSITDSLVPNECNGIILVGAVQAFVTGGTPPYTYMWNNNQSWATAGMSGLPNGIYTVLVRDANNCTDTSTMEVVFNDCCTPFLPNAFTPNGDGKNEIFRFRFVGDMYIVRFSIYNRFGQEVFNLENSTDLDRGWDGKLQGVPAEMGVYFYYAKIICGNKRDHIKEMKGDVTLVR